MGTVSSFFTTLMVTASFWYFFVISKMGFGIVAENSTVCRSSGMYSSTVSISSRNPILSISSASSNTMVFTSSHLIVLRLKWSITRPGVPIIIWAPPFKERICFTMSCPPYTGSTFTPCMYLARLRTSSATWIASSLVGQRTIACVFLLWGSTFINRGIPKAAVLPVPVCACPITSTPSITTGMALH